MSKAIPIALLLGGCLLLWLLYLNRSSSKIQEATVVIAIVIIGALVFVTKGESLRKTIYTAYFISHKNQTPLFFSDTPVLGRYYLYQDIIFSSYRKRLSEQKKKISFDFPSDEKPLIDLQAIAILHHLLVFYGNYWYVERESREVPGGRMGTSSPIEIENVGKDSVKYALPDSLKENMFFDYLTWPTNLALPRNTKIYYTSDESKHSLCEYRFYKRFNFDIRIKIRLSSYMIGLGNVGRYVGLVKTEYKSIKVEDAKNYGNIILFTTCEAKFNRIRAWNPSVVRYKRWTKNLFDDLYNTFDWSICQSEMRNYQQALSSQKIIDKFK